MPDEFQHKTQPRPHGRCGFSSVTGGIHLTAIIGHPPEMRDWRPGDKQLPPHIHPTARIEAYVTVDAGSYRPTTIGARTWLMKKVHIGHDALIGEDCELTPGVIVGGEVTIGHRVQIKLGALIRPQITIGDDALIGMGAVVIDNVPAGAVMVGNPARILRYRDGHEQADATNIRVAQGREPDHVGRA